MVTIISTDSAATNVVRFGFEQLRSTPTQSAGYSYRQYLNNERSYSFKSRYLGQGADPDSEVQGTLFNLAQTLKLRPKVRPLRTIPSTRSQ